MALASQSVRAQSMPRSSEMFSRGKRARNKRLVGVVLLAVVCVGIAMWAVRGRDGLPSPAGAAAVPPPATLNDNVVAANPMGGNPASPSTRPSTPAGESRTVPMLSMGEVKEPLAGATSGATDLRKLQSADPAPTAAPTGGMTTPPPPAPVSEPTAPATQPAAAPASDFGSGGALASTLAAADRASAQGRPLEARGVLNRALVDPRSTDSERATLRKKLAELNQNLVFGPAQTPGDPFSETYRVVAGDSLVKITRKLQLITEPSLIARVNKLANPGALKVGQTLKVLRGPFHAVVDKSEFRMDIYAGSTPSPTSIGTSPLADGAEPGWTYICSFSVGLGTQGLTPIGAFTVKDNSKLVNPHWVNPRTGEKFGADDPKNPIGERWMGLEGIDDKSKAFTGYGIHGTIDPASVGHEMSMGCVRMNAADVEQVYELLTPRVSVVKIMP